MTEVTQQQQQQQKETAGANPGGQVEKVQVAELLAICTLEIPGSLGEQPSAGYKAMVLSLVNYALCMLSELKLFTVYLTFRPTPLSSKESITLLFNCCLVLKLHLNFCDPKFQLTLQRS